jgi:2-iminobutanoate/2-iminopropanoate deaminase
MIDKTVVVTDNAPRPIQGAPYSQAIRCGELVFVSGQLPVAPGTGQIAGTTIQDQTEQVLRNVAAILEAAGSGMDRLVRTTVFLARLDDFAGMNEVYRRHVGDRPPARSTVEVSKLPFGALLEVDAIAHV